MWLLNTKTLRLHYYQADPPDYVILSHTWGDEEVAFEEMQGKQRAIRKKQGYQKIVGCCIQALRDGFEWAWVDTCCIDKRSSAELSEAINSMYQWYWRAAICYVYLSDVRVEDTKQAFKDSRWFTRGWTLQELLAPAVVEFYAQSWDPLGSKTQNVIHIRESTNIDSVYIQDRESIQDASIATKFSWASRRQTTRIEDAAYCLLGLVQVNMPMLYGEGKRAFHRLQLELLRKKNDHTILAWSHDQETHISRGVLAPSLSYFEKSAQFQESAASSTDEIFTHDVTNHGLRMTLMCRPGGTDAALLARLECVDQFNRPLALELQHSSDDHQYKRRRLVYTQNWDNYEIHMWEPRLLYLAIDEDYSIELEERLTLIAMRGIQPVQDCFPNGITVSTRDKVTIAQRMYDKDNPFNAGVALKQLEYIRRKLFCSEDMVACVRMGSRLWEPGYQAVIFGIHHGRPMIHCTTNMKDLFSKNWYRELYESPAKYVRDHARFVNNQFIIEMKAKKIRWTGGFGWTLDVKAFRCICDTSTAPYYERDCICDVTEEVPEASGDTYEKETGVWKRIRQKLHPTNPRHQTLEDVRVGCHLVECSCYECEKEGKIEVHPTHFVECNCWDCQRESKIEVRPQYCGCEGCTICEDSQKATALAAQMIEEEKDGNTGLSTGWLNELVLNLAFFQ